MNSPFALPLALPEPLARVDLARTVAELDGVFRRHGARTQAAPLDLTFARGRWPGAAVASIVLESDRIARAVVTHVRVAPFYAGLALAVHPHSEIDAPILVADVQVPPPGRLRAYVDVCGPAVTAESFAPLRDGLSAVLSLAHDAHRTSVPSWIAPFSGGVGARLRAPFGRGEHVLRTLVDYVDRYLLGLASAPVATAPAANLAAARAVRNAVRTHGPARAHLARSFGAPFADAYLALLWRDDG